MGEGHCNSLRGGHVGGLGVGALESFWRCCASPAPWLRMPRCPWPAAPTPPTGAGVTRPVPGAGGILGAPCTCENAPSPAQAPHVSHTPGPCCSLARRMVPLVLVGRGPRQLPVDGETRPPWAAGVGAQPSLSGSSVVSLPGGRDRGEGPRRPCHWLRGGRRGHGNLNSEEHLAGPGLSPHPGRSLWENSVRAFGEKPPGMTAFARGPLGPTSRQRRWAAWLCVQGADGERGQERLPGENDRGQKWGGCSTGKSGAPPGRLAGARGPCVLPRRPHAQPCLAHAGPQGGLTSHLPRRPVSCSLDQMLWILPACSGWLLVFPQAHWCFSISVSYTRPGAEAGAAEVR